MTKSPALCKIGQFLATVGLIAGLSPLSQAGDLDSAFDTVIKANRAAAKSQAKIDALNEKTSDLLSQYRAVQEQIANIKTYNAQVNRLLVSQRAEVDLLREQIDGATQVGRDATPLMLRMLASLEAFVELDLPFLIEERKNRVAELKKMMDRADVTDSEKYRRLLEAYQVETEFGRTIEAYKGDLKTNGTERTVNFFRFGRVSLTYLSLDEKEAGMWDTKTKAWAVLPNEYRTSVKKGLRIARKQTAPDLIRIPVPAAEAAK